jgi:hypothetical protein
VDDLSSATHCLVRSESETRTKTKRARFPYVYTTTRSLTIPFAFCKKKTQKSGPCRILGKGVAGPRRTRVGGGWRAQAGNVSSAKAGIRFLSPLSLLRLCCHRLCTSLIALSYQRSFPAADRWYRLFSFHQRNPRPFSYIYVYLLIEQKRENEKGLPFFDLCDVYLLRAK